MIDLFLSWSYLLNTNVNWSGILDGINRLFLGGNWTDTLGFHSVDGLFGGSTEMMALFIFLFFLIMTFFLGLGMLVGSVVIIPSLFAIFQYIPSMKIIVGLVCGLIFGFALQRMYRR
jgi:hypothetical protein